jgi:hypothetical protein
MKEFHSLASIEVPKRAVHLQPQGKASHLQKSCMAWWKDQLRPRGAVCPYADDGETVCDKVGLSAEVLGVSNVNLTLLGGAESSELPCVELP